MECARANAFGTKSEQNIEKWAKDASTTETLLMECSERDTHQLRTDNKTTTVYSTSIVRVCLSPWVCIRLQFGRYFEICQFLLFTTLQHAIYLFIVCLCSNLSMTIFVSTHTHFAIQFDVNHNNENTHTDTSRPADTTKHTHTHTHRPRRWSWKWVRRISAHFFFFSLFSIFYNDIG